MTHKKDQHHSSYKLTEHLNGKHFLYAGLATTTLIGGMGATPLVLADKTTTTQTELVTKKKAKKAKAQKESRDFMSGGDAYEFSADDFDVEDGVIMGFTESFGEYQFADDANWDGAVTFPAEFATTITGINEGAFSGERIRTVDLNSLTALETIGEEAFANNEFLEAVDISNLANLKTIGAGAFERCENLETINLVNLPLLTSLGNVLSDEYWDWNLNYDGVFQNCPNLKTVTFDRLNSLEALGSYMFSDCGIETLTLTNMPNLTWIGQNFYEMHDDENKTLSLIIVGNLNAELLVKYSSFWIPAPGALIVPVNGDSASDRQVAHAILFGINGAGDAEGSLFGKEKSQIGGAITYKYIDQNEKVIKTGIDNTPVKSFTISGAAGTNYALPTIPTIMGYGKPTLFSGTETGTFDYGMQEVVYQYQAATSAITIYRVDTNDKNLVVPEKVSGFANDLLDLDDKQLAINGYDFDSLNVSALSRAVGAFTWQPAPDSVGKSLTFGANAGRSYKFVYTKAAVDTPTKNTDSSSSSSSATNNSNTSNNAASSSSEKAPATATSAANASSVSSTNNDNKNDESTSTPSTTQNPNGLPSTGGNDTRTSGANNNRTVTSRSSNTRYVPLRTNTARNKPTSQHRNNPRKLLPQSGVVVNRVLPALGAVALAGMLGLYAFSKKNKL